MWTDERRRNVSLAMKRYHAARSEEHREAERQKQVDAAVCRIWTSRNPGVAFKKGRTSVPTPESIQRRTFTNVRAASIKRILKDIVATEPELIREALIQGLMAPPPRSFPYIALAAAYLDGKPVEGPPPDHGIPDLSHLSTEELREQVMVLAERIHAENPKRIEAENPKRLPVIDVTPEVQDEE